MECRIERSPIIEPPSYGNLKAGETFRWEGYHVPVMKCNGGGMVNLQTGDYVRDPCVSGVIRIRIARVDHAGVPVFVDA
jgi:hypothetical protein